MRKYLTILVAIALSGSISAAQTVTIHLDSPQDGQNLEAGATVNWTISVEVSTGDNAGLALVSADLVHGATNPETFDIPPGTEGSIDSTMAQFAGPNGLSNPAEGGAETGYIGVQRGMPGAMILRQIGGAQNSFGVAGQAMGLDANVEGGVGQSGSQIVVSGSFTAPATSGTYSYQLSNILANVFSTVNAAPNPSLAIGANVDASDASFSFTVGSVISLGDMNCDGSVNLGDVPAMAEALVDPAAYAINYPTCDPLNGDFADDDVLTGADIAGFVSALLAP